MLLKVQCHRIISRSSTSALVSTVKAQMNSIDYEVQVDVLPALSDFYPRLGTTKADDAPVEPYPPSNKPIDPDRVVMYIHSSGSTGFPKPIPHTEKITLQWCQTCELTHIRWLADH